MLQNPDVCISPSISEKKINFKEFANKDYKQNDYSCNHEQKNFSFNVVEAKLIWKANFGSSSDSKSTITPNIVIADGIIYGGDRQGNIVFFDTKTQKTKRSISLEKNWEDIAKIGGLALLENNDLLVTLSNGDLVLIDTKEGIIKKKNNLNCVIRSAPCVSGNKVFVQGTNNTISALDNNLDLLWKQEEIQEDVIFLGTSSIAYDNSLVLAAYSTGEYKAYEDFSGNEIWADFMMPLFQDSTFASLLHIYASPVISQNLVIVFGHGGKLVANHAMSGKKAWELNITGFHTPAVIDNWVFVIDSSSRMFCIEKTTGKIKWQKQVLLNGKKNKNLPLTTKPLVVGNCVVTATNDGRILFFSCDTGDLVKDIKTDMLSPKSLIIADKTIYILTNSGKLYAYK